MPSDGPQQLCKTLRKPDLNQEGTDMTNPPSGSSHLQRKANSATSAQDDADDLADAEEGYGEDDSDCDAPDRPPTVYSSDLSWVVPLLLLAVGAVTEPQWLWALEHWGDPTTPVAQGVVQRVVFIGNLGIDSQIDTETRSFMVRGVSHLQKGWSVETRKSTWSVQLCSTDAAVCEDLMGVH